MTLKYIEGGHALEGSVRPSGSRDAAAKLIIASLFSNEDIILENVPKTTDIEVIIEIIISIGGYIKWIGDNKLAINGSQINKYEVPFEIGVRSKYTLLLAGPLLFRFGKARVQKAILSSGRTQAINRWVDTWECLGIKVEQDKDQVYLEADSLHGATVNFKINTHSGTANAIFSSCFIQQETIINNADEGTELEDLVDFFMLMGVEIERVEPRRIRVVGRNVFKGGYFEVHPESIEAVAFATLALTSKGNINIKGIKKLRLTSFVNFLTKIGSRYEYDRDELNVWYGGEEIQPTILESSPSPGFLTDWLPYAALLMTQAHGKSVLNDTVYLDRFGYVQDLNRMGADINLKMPSEEGLQCVISDESYDYAKFGEPKTLITVDGPTRLRGTRLDMGDSRFNALLIAAALSAEGKSELIGVEDMFVRYERFFDKLSDLGAVIS